MRHDAPAAVLGGMIITVLATPALATEAALPSPEEMWAIIQSQQAEIQALKARLDETEANVEAAGDMIEAVQTDEAASGGPGWWQRTQLGGYGEVHYNGGDADQVDFHRYVLTVGHDFTDDLRMFSEVELEHSLAGDGAPGEVELEQAFIEYDITDTQHVKGGLFLIPVGILNETHEPPTFFGVERNRVETNIIPTTWWEAGVGANGELGAGFSYDLAAHSGLMVPTTGSNAYLIRSGRQKVAEAKASDGAVTARVKWTGYPGVELGAAAQYQDDVTQNAVGLGTPAFLVTAHTDLLIGGWGLRALYARWDLAEGPPNTGAGAFGRDEQVGWYIEPSYRFEIGTFGELGLFGRYSAWDNEAGAEPDSEYQAYHVGLNYWPHPDVVLKLDGEFQSNPSMSGKDDNRLNLGLGFQF